MIVFAPIDANDQLMEADLDGSTYYVGLSWNEEGQFWTISIRDLSGEYLISSIAAVPDWPLLAYYRSTTLPPGELVLLTATGGPPARAGFADGTALLLYVTDEEWKAL